MIHVTYDRKHYKVTINGHAGSAEVGHDLVCASASILAYTLAADVVHAKEHGYLRNGTAKLEPGDTEIRCLPRSRYKMTMMLVFDSICAGFELLAQNHPENISYELK